MHTFLLNGAAIKVPNCEVEKVKNLTELMRLKHSARQRVYAAWVSESRNEATKRRRVLVGTLLGYISDNVLKEGVFECVLCVS